MKNKITTYFLSKKIKSLPQRTATLLSDKEIQSILIVSNKAIPDIINYASNEFKQAKIELLCKGNKKQKESALSNTHFVDASDFGLTGSIKNEAVLKLLQTNFDLVIDLSDNAPILTYLISASKAKMVAGMAGENSQNKIHDIFVPFTGNFEIFITQTKSSINLIANK